MPLAYFISLIIFSFFSIIFGLLSGQIISRVTLLSGVGTDQRDIVLGVSTTFLIVVLCFFVLLAHIDAIYSVGYVGYSFPHGIMATFYAGCFYNVNEEIHNNRDAVATELWKRQMLPFLQKRCFTSSTTVCDLADRVESETPGLDQLLVSCLAILFAISAAKTCIQMTKYYMIREQIAETKQYPEARKNYFRVQRTHPKTTRILILLSFIGLFICGCLIIPVFGVSPVLGPYPARNSVMTESLVKYNALYNPNYMCFVENDKSVNQGGIACSLLPSEIEKGAIAPVEVSEMALWFGPWYSTLVPGIAAGLCLIAAVEGVLLGVLKREKPASPSDVIRSN